MEYNDLSAEAVDGLLGPDFYFRIKCMYDMLAMRQGVDPDKPPTDGAGKQGPETRKVSGVEAVAVLKELSEIKERAKQKEG